MLWRLRYTDESHPDLWIQRNEDMILEWKWTSDEERATWLDMDDILFLVSTGWGGKYGYRLEGLTCHSDTGVVIPWLMMA